MNLRESLLRVIEDLERQRLLVSGSLQIRQNMYMVRCTLRSITSAEAVLNEFGPITSRAGYAINQSWSGPLLMLKIQKAVVLSSGGGGETRVVERIEVGSNELLNKVLYLLASTGLLYAVHQLRALDYLMW